MPTREYRCAECGGTFTHELIQGRPRVCCEDCAPIRKRKQIQEWERARTPEQRRAQYEKQRDRAIARATAWNQANRERRAEITRKFSQQPHIRARARSRNYAKGDLRDYVDILAGDPCCYCGEPSQHIDHIEPLARDGANSPDNLTAACVRCNVVKSAKPMLLFLLERR